jgi:chemotaxis protein histidine kinase CheA
MNRSILIVICDFFLVSLLAFSTPDISKLSQSGGTPVMNMSNLTNQVTARQDVSDAMRLALYEEQRDRTNIQAELARAQQIVGERGQEITNVQSQLRTAEQVQANLREQEASLRQQDASLREQEANLMQQVATIQAAAQSNLAAMTSQLIVSKEQTARTDEQRAALEQARKQLEERNGALENQLAGLQQSNQAIQAERATLNTKLQVTEVQRQSALEKATQLQTEVEAQREVNAKLADTVKTLAVQSNNMASNLAQVVQEIRENRELTPNEIFEQLTTNRAMASFYGLKRGLFGIDSSKYKQTQIPLASDGSNTYAICHVQDTLLTLWTPGQWEDLSGTLVHDAAVFPIDSISFSPQDPRVVMIPIAAAEGKVLNCKTYRLAEDPFKFQEAVVAGTQDNYYGECKFQLDLETPGYLKMDRSSLKGLFGKFNPSTGDLVLSKTGELLGIMVNNNYCMVLRALTPGVQVRFGWAGDNPKTTQTLTDLAALVFQMPAKLQ